MEKLPKKEAARDGQYKSEIKTQANIILALVELWPLKK
jgi:hypothetical protein